MTAVCYRIARVWDSDEQGIQGLRTKGVTPGVGLQCRFEEPHREMIRKGPGIGFQHGRDIIDDCNSR
jgi:hypothetical protein